MFSPSASISPHLQSIYISQDVGMPQCLHSLECCFSQLCLLLCTLGHFVQKHRHWLPSRLQRKCTGSQNSTIQTTSESEACQYPNLIRNGRSRGSLFTCNICVLSVYTCVRRIKYTKESNCEIHQIQSANNSVFPVLSIRLTYLCQSTE